MKNSVQVACVLILGLAVAPAMANAQLLGGAVGGGGNVGGDIGSMRGAGSIGGDISGRVDSDLYGRTTDGIRRDTDTLRRQGRDTVDDARRSADADVYAEARGDTRTRRNRAYIDAEANAGASADVDVDARGTVDNGRAIVRQGVRTGRNAVDSAASSDVDVSAQASGRASAEAH